jgi:hypothetical protein
LRGRRRPVSRVERAVSLGVGCQRPVPARFNQSRLKLRGTSMRNRLIRLAILAAMVVSMSGTALAQICPTGYYFQGGMCYLAPAPGGVGGGTQAAPVHGADGKCTLFERRQPACSRQRRRRRGWRRERWRYVARSAVALTLNPKLGHVERRYATTHIYDVAPSAIKIGPSLGPPLRMASPRPMGSRSTPLALAISGRAISSRSSA